MNARPGARFRLIAVLPDRALLPALDRLDEILDPATDTVSWFEAGKGLWRIEALTATEPDPAATAVLLNGAPVTVEPLPEIDWLAENRKSFKPVRAGRFFVHPSDPPHAVPSGRIGIELDAGLAFGSGSHETTQGCLLAIDRLTRRHRFRRPLDLGCGSGILAIALAKAGPARVLASDIDPVAVRVARGNAQRNRVQNRVRVVVSPGWSHRDLRAVPRFDLIVANILARPLIRMAPETAGRLAPGGALVLSGLMVHQAPAVLRAYRSAGLKVDRVQHLGDWSTITCRKA